MLYGELDVAAPERGDARRHSRRTNAGQLPDAIENFLMQGNDAVALESRRARFER